MEFKVNILNLDPDSSELVRQVLRCPANKRSLYDLGLALGFVTTILNENVDNGELITDIYIVKDNPQSTALIKLKQKYYLRCSELLDCIMSVAGFSITAVLDLVILIYYSQVLEITRPISHCWSVNFKGYKDIPQIYNEWIVSETGMSDLSYITNLSLCLIKAANEEVKSRESGS